MALALKELDSQVSRQGVLHLGTQTVPVLTVTLSLRNSSVLFTTHRQYRVGVALAMCLYSECDFPE